MKSRCITGLWIVGSLALGTCNFAGAAIYTVGPAGTHPGLQAALNAAAANPANDEVRAQAIDFTGPISVQVNAATGSLVLSGGWNAGFSAQIAGGLDPIATVVNANELASNLRVQATAGVLEISAMRLVFGQGSDTNTGGNLTANVGGNASVRFTDVHFNQGRASNLGAGGFATVFGSGALHLVACSFANNRVDAVSGSTFGAGLAVAAFDSARVELDQVSIFGNESLGAIQNLGAGLSILARNGSLVRIADLELASNYSTASGSSSALSIAASESALIDLQRIRASSNSATALNSSQIAIDNRDLATTYLSDSVIADSNLIAHLTITQGSGGSVRLNNLTVIRNRTPGQLFEAAGSPITMHNSIVHGNGAATLAVSGGNNLGSNLGLAAPVFAGPSDYRLGENSPGIDAGSAAIPGGLGALDVDRNPRVIGSSVDIGAAEFIPDTLFVSGFE